MKAIDILEDVLSGKEVEFKNTRESDRRKYWNLEHEIKDLRRAIRILSIFDSLKEVLNQE